MVWYDISYSHNSFWLFFLLTDSILESNAELSLRSLSGQLPHEGSFYGNFVQFSLPICYFLGYNSASHLEFYPDIVRLHYDFWLGLLVSYRSELVLLSQICFLSRLINISINWLISSVFNGPTCFSFALVLCENLLIQDSILIIFQNSKLMIRESAWLSSCFAA